MDIAFDRDCRQPDRLLCLYKEAVINRYTLPHVLYKWVVTLSNIEWQVKNKS